MGRVAVAILLLVVGVAGLGFYRGWFTFTSDSSDSKSNVSLTVDREKVEEDRKALTEKVRGSEN